MVSTSLKTESSQNLFEKAFRSQWETVRLLDNPTWLQDLHLRGLSRFDVLGFPTRKNEAWKYINLRPLLDTHFEAYQPADRPDAEMLKQRLKLHWLKDKQIIRLVLVNGQFDEALSEGLDNHGTPAVFQSLKRAATTHAQQVQENIGQYLEQEPDALAALNTALFEDGAFIYVPADVKVEPIVQLVFINTGAETPKTAHLRNLIVLEQGAKLNMSVQFLGFDSEVPYFSNLVQEIKVAPDAELNLTFLQFEGCKSWHVSAQRIYLQERSKVSLNTIALGGLMGRHSVQTVLRGEGAECHLNGLNVLEGDSEVYHHTVIEHWLPNATSRQFYKGILEDSAKSEFNGTIFVAPDANGTDSEQLNQNLVISDNARVYTRPQLQINADDVKCAHGATVGQLQEDQLFYLASRGIDAQTARGILTYGFAEELIQRIPHRALRQYLDLLVLDNLHDTDNATIGRLKGCQIN